MLEHRDRHLLSTNHQVAGFPKTASGTIHDHELPSDPPPGRSTNALCCYLSTSLILRLQSKSWLTPFHCRSDICDTALHITWRIRTTSCHTSLRSQPPDNLFSKSHHRFAILPGKTSTRRKAQAQILGRRARFSLYSTASGRENPSVSSSRTTTTTNNQR